MLSLYGNHFITFSFFFFFFVFAFSRAAPAAHGDSQARGVIETVAAAHGDSQARGVIETVATGLHQSHSYVGFELCLRPTPQLMATPDP